MIVSMSMSSSFPKTSCTPNIWKFGSFMNIFCCDIDKGIGFSKSWSSFIKGIMFPNNVWFVSLCYSSNNNFDVSFSKNGNLFKTVIVFTKLSWLDGNALSITCTILWLGMISLVPINWVMIFLISLRKFETWVVFVCAGSKVSFPTINYWVELWESYKFLRMFHTSLGSSTFAMHGNNSS